MTTLTIALLIACGFVLLVIEVLLIPGFSIPGVAGIALIAFGVWRARLTYGANGALIALFLSFLGAFVIIKLAIRSRAVRNVGLDFSEKGATAPDDYSNLQGKEGIALSILRPAGIALIEGTRYDVVADCEYIEKDSPVRVREVEGVRIIVTRMERD